MDSMFGVATATESRAAGTAPAAPQGCCGVATQRVLGSSSPQQNTDSQVSLSGEDDDEVGSTKPPNETKPEEPDDLDEQPPEKQIEILKREIEKLRDELARQRASGDEAGARATEARLNGLQRQLDGLRGSGEAAAPVSAAPAAGSAASPGAGFAPGGSA
ncbi:MAG: hypothetical protein FJX76_22320, partial [Armatimonadetes bacterium]|nr:hypothetical protein [Armatimonadota bacterium]